MSQTYDATLRAYNPRSSGGLITAKNQYTPLKFSHARLGKLSRRYRNMYVAQPAGVRRNKLGLGAGSMQYSSKYNYNYPNISAVNVGAKNIQPMY